MTRRLRPLPWWVPILILLVAWAASSRAREVSGDASGHWTVADSPVILTGSCIVASGASLLIEPGVQVFLAPGASLHVDGFLTALGTTTQPIRLDPLTAGSPWRCISISAMGQALMGSCVVRGGGLSQPDELGAAIRVDGGQLNLMGCEVSGSASSGVLVMGGVLMAASSRFDRNGGSQPIDAGIHVVTGSVSLAAGAHANSITNSVFGLYNDDIVPVMAQGTWWGSATGPQHASNVPGIGVSVSDDVDFSNHITIDPRPTLGDVDRDGHVTVLDVAIVLKVVGGLSATDGITQALGDVQGDGVLDMADAQAIALAASGLRALP